MTPLEKAVEAGNALDMTADGYWFVKFEPSQASAIITAFLEAAAEDEDATLSAGLAASRAEDAWGGAPNPEDQGKAAILALKETING